MAKSRNQPTEDVHLILEKKVEEANQFGSSCDCDSRTLCCWCCLGLGFNANSLELGCDCVGYIHYMDATVNTHDGKPNVIKNAVCIHEEDFGILWKVEFCYVFFFFFF